MVLEVVDVEVDLDLHGILVMWVDFEIRFTRSR